MIKLKELNPHFLSTHLVAAGLAAPDGVLGVPFEVLTPTDSLDGRAVEVGVEVITRRVGIRDWEPSSGNGNRDFRTIHYLLHHHTHLYYLKTMWIPDETVVWNLVDSQVENSAWSCPMILRASIRSCTAPMASWACGNVPDCSRCHSRSRAWTRITKIAMVDS